jgi:hypothetical protein
MALTLPWPLVRQALIQPLRANLVLADQLLGDWSQGAAPQGTDYPLGVISLVPSPANYDWSGVVWDLLVDVVVFSKDQGEADRLDQLVFTTLQDASLAVTGLTSLTCRRTGTIALQDVDQAGTVVFESGGTFGIRLAQSTPTAGTLTVTADSTIA